MYPKTKGKEVNKMFNVDDLLKDLEAFNQAHDKELNPTQGEKELIELREAVNKLKEERKAQSEKNRAAMKAAQAKTENPVVQDYVALVSKKRKEFKENYF